MASGVPTIFSPRRRAMRDARAAGLQRHRSAPATWLHEAMAEDLIERIGFMRLEPRRALLIGAASLSVRPSLGAQCEVVHADGADVRDTFERGEFDLIVATGWFDTLNDLPGALLLARLALRDGGMLLATIPAAGSLPTLRRVMIAADGDRAAPRIHPQIDNRAATMLLERAGFARQVVDGFGFDVRYGSLARLVDDLREQGQTSVLDSPGPALDKAALVRARTAFASLAGEDGKTVEHFELLTLTGWKS